VRAFRTRVAATIARYQMIAPGDTVLVALSAGADSTALLHALVRLSERLHCRICACHVHHGLRGEEADGDAEHAAAFAKSLDLMFWLVRADVRSHAAAHRLSLETAAREVRYQLLGQAAQAHGVARIATGHTADDQAETVLLNLLRGTGPTGLAGIPPVRGNIIRPLLGVTHTDVEQYCRAGNLTYRIDRSNRDLRFTRNRIRHQAMPVLRQLQPRITEALCRLAAIIRDEDDFMSAQAQSEVERMELTIEALDGLPIPIRGFADLHPALQRRVARAAIAHLKRDGRDIELERVEALANLLVAGRTGARIQLPDGLVASRGYRQVFIAKAEDIEPPPSGEWDLPVPGEVEIRRLGFEFKTSRSTAKLPPADVHTALLDAAKVTELLRVRTWRPGDRLIPLGMSKPVKLQDLFVNEKVPRALRPWVPLVLCGDRILWVVGHRISDEFKVTAQTRRTIRIQATEQSIPLSED
jgi:tRNA(Ile)-lysidine synthase